jgi:hypothetical protein
LLSSSKHPDLPLNLQAPEALLRCCCHPVVAAPCCTYGQLSLPHLLLLLLLVGAAAVVTGVVGPGLATAQRCC